MRVNDDKKYTYFFNSHKKTSPLLLKSHICSNWLKSFVHVRKRQKEPLVQHSTSFRLRYKSATSQDDAYILPRVSQVLNTIKLSPAVAHSSGSKDVQIYLSKSPFQHSIHNKYSTITRSTDFHSITSTDDNPNSWKHELHMYHLKAYAWLAHIYNLKKDTCSGKKYPPDSGRIHHSAL